MKLSSGFAALPELIQAGVQVGLGTDGSNVNNNLDLFEEMKIASLIQSGHRSDPLAIDLQSIFRMATISGARALGLDSMIGSLEKGKRADLVIVNLNTLHTTPLMKGEYNNVIPHLVFSSSGNDVEAVFVDGRQLVEDGRLLTVNEQEVIDQAQSAAEEIVRLKKPLILRGNPIPVQS
jgi:5-methylthioadenosine/S-adenosylhomocysteine deaminase